MNIRQTAAIREVMCKKVESGNLERLSLDFTDSHIKAGLDRKLEELEFEKEICRDDVNVWN